MSEFKGDYLGFTYNGKHSSALGIVRTSNGSRFNENLLPTIQDKTVQVPGGDGTYFFGSYYTQRQFSVPFAFDGLTEEQLSELKRHFGDKKIHDLVFDEAPYKAYRAKVTGTAQIKHIVFDETCEKTELNDMGMQRIYKGDGTIQFTCYSPYAVCRHKGRKDDYYDDYRDTEHLWAAVSGLPYDWKEWTEDLLQTGQWEIDNVGDIEMPFQLGLAFDVTTGKIPSGSISLDGVGFLQWKEIVRQNESSDAVVVFDTSTNLLEGYRVAGKELVKSGNLYNQYLTRGAFFHLPRGHSKLKLASLDENVRPHVEFLRYDYYYF